MIFYLKEVKGLKLMIFIADGPKYFLEYLRAPFLLVLHSFSILIGLFLLVHCYSIYLYLTFLYSYLKMVLLITLMIIRHTQQVTEFTTLYLI